MRIGVDLDGVVADFTKGWTTQYALDFGKEILEEEITDWGLSKPLTHFEKDLDFWNWACLLYTSPSPRDATLSRMPSSA